MKEIFSKKYNKWFILDPTKCHQKTTKLFRFGKYYYRPDKDMMIHEDIIDEYIANTFEKQKNYKRQFAIEKKSKKNQDLDNFFKKV